MTMAPSENFFAALQIPEKVPNLTEAAKIARQCQVDSALTVSWGTYAGGTLAS